MHYKDELCIEMLGTNEIILLSSAVNIKTNTIAFPFSPLRKATR